MTVHWDKEIGSKCGETWASRATTLSCAAAQRAAGNLPPISSRRRSKSSRAASIAAITFAISRPGPERRKLKLNPTTHLTFSYATQVVILDDEGRLERVVAAHDVGHAINPKACAGQIEGGVHMGLGYALSEKLESPGGVPDSLNLRDLGILQAKDTPRD